METTLLADIGGTNIRFGLLRKGQVTHLSVYPHDLGLSAEEAVRQYLSKTRSHPDCFVAGAAGILEKSGQIMLTNRDFVFNLPALCQTFEFKQGLLSNDMSFHALAMADKPDTKRACVIFVGTGLGVAYIYDGLVHPTEDGHRKIYRPNQEEKALNAMVWEDIISGPAFLKIYRAMEGTYKPVMQSREVSYLAHNVKDKNAILTYQIIARTLAKFCAHTAQTKKVSVFYLGGQAVEILRLPIGQETFFQGLGKWADVLGIRIIRPSEQSAMTGLSMVAEELRQTGTTTRLAPKSFYVWRG
ncbi:MAG: ROK family protein [Alphaproteobacteria bacterium]|nr:ROK family protein [Alphaproteobacteria bacterium]